MISQGGDVPITPMGGASEDGGVSGAADAADAGDGGTSAGAAGAAGTPSDGGAAGDAGDACVQAGMITDLKELPNLGPILACRSARSFVGIASYTDASTAFTCCARVGRLGIGVPVQGDLASADPSLLLFYLPKDTPLGLQPFELECPGTGLVAGLTQLAVIDQPQVQYFTPQMHASDEMHITGLHLAGVNVDAVAVGSTSGLSCIPNGTGVATDSFYCRFIDPITPGVYTLLISNGGCIADIEPQFTVLP